MFRATRPLRLAATLALLVGSATAQTTLTFWHAMEAGEEVIESLLTEYHARQSEVRVEARYVGSYAEAQTRLLAAFGTPSAPALFQAELGFFPRLVEDGALHDLADLAATLPSDTIDDFFPGMWAYGEFDGARYGLPWNTSTPVMYYDATALRRADVAVPTTWAEFEAAARALTRRNVQGAMLVGDAWLFETMVLTRGGRLADDAGAPTLNGPEAIAALTQLQGLVRDRALSYHGATESTPAMLSFVRGRNLITFASIANWPDVRRFSIGFDLAAAPVPIEPGGRLPLGGAQLVVLASATDAERRAAFDFWTFLIEPANLARWIEATYYIPIRRSAVPLLDDFYAADPNRAAALAQLELAIPRPRSGAFASWQGFLHDALDQALRGGRSAAEALAEAQRRALAVGR